MRMKLDTAHRRCPAIFEPRSSITETSSILTLTGLAIIWEKKLLADFGLSPFFFEVIDQLLTRSAPPDARCVGCPEAGGSIFSRSSTEFL